MAEDEGVVPADKRSRFAGIAWWILLTGIVVVVVTGVYSVVRVRTLRDGSRPMDAVDIAPVADPSTFADGVVSIHGEDYAYDVAHERIVVCDQEHDGRPVKVEYETSDGTSGELFDLSHARRDCTALDVDQEITRHRVCEANITWTCHNWQATS